MARQLSDGTRSRQSTRLASTCASSPAGHNQRLNDTLNQMAIVVAGMVGKRLRYRDLVGDGNKPLAGNVT